MFSILIFSILFGYCNIHWALVSTGIYLSLKSTYYMILSEKLWKMKYWYAYVQSYSFIGIECIIFHYSMYFPYSNSHNIVPLQVGAHDYVDYFNNNGIIETIPIRTKIRGLCYKLKLSNPFNYFQLFIGSSIQNLDKLDKMYQMIAKENTWQGIVEGHTVKVWRFQKVSIKNCTNINDMDAGQWSILWPISTWLINFEIFWH